MRVWVNSSVPSTCPELRSITHGECERYGKKREKGSGEVDVQGDTADVVDWASTDG